MYQGIMLLDLNFSDNIKENRHGKNKNLKAQKNQGKIKAIRLKE